jgi:hypothetical protein
VKRQDGRVIAGAGSALILVLTLWPASGDVPQQFQFWCVLCGHRDVADGLLNVLLFAPFGAGLAIARGPMLAIGGSFALSGMVEFVQATVPGRVSTLGDILFNTAGGAAGAVFVAFRGRIAALVVAPPPWAKVLAGLVPPAIFLATAALSAPRFPESEYHGQWARELGTLRPYPGEVVSATIGEIPLPDHRIPNQDDVRRALRAGEPLLLEVVAGPPPAQRSHLVAVYDDRQREVLLVTVQGSNLYFQQRTLSVHLLLDPPTLRWNGALDVREGDTVRIAVRPEPRGLCVEVDHRVRCDLLAGVGGGWRLIHRLWSAPPWLVALLGVVWLSALTLPAGAALGRCDRGVAVGLALGLIGVVVSWWSPWLSAHLVDLVAPIPGAWAGWGVRRRLARRA